MNHYTVVTQGEDARLLLETLLDIAPDDSRVRVVAAGGWSGADSYARSLLMRGDRECRAGRGRGRERSEAGGISQTFSARFAWRDLFREDSVKASSLRLRLKRCCSVTARHWKTRQVVPFQTRNSFALSLSQKRYCWKRSRQRRSWKSIAPHCRIGI